jgi:signal transduction histidine kinase/ActR/RegA family two-component response regulator
MWLRALDQVVPASLRADRTTGVRARVAAFTLVLAVTFGPLLVVTEAAAHRLSAFGPSMMLAGLVAFMVLRSTRSLTWVAHVVGVSGLAILSYGAWITSAQTGIMMWFALVPLTVLAIGGPRIGAVWAAVFTVAACSEIAIARMTSTLPWLPPGSPWFQAVNIGLAASWVLGHALVLELARESALRDVDQAHAAAEASSRAKTDFLANVSHELRTPMNAVIGMTGLLRETTLDEHQREYTDVIRSSGVLLLELINEVLDLAKIEAGKLVLEESPFNLHDSLRQVMQLVRPLARSKDLEATLVVDTTVPLWLRGDHARLRQVLLNLGANAVKFTERGHVTLHASAGAVHNGAVPLTLVVEDTGIGIPPEAVSRLFKAFSQVDASTTRRFGGTGLGLAISRQIIEAMGGTIDVDSAPGRGSRFRVCVRLPLVEPLIAQPTPLPATVPVRPLRLLLGEDTPVNQRVAAHVLESHGHTCDRASNGVEALEALSRARYDVVLMDCQMPELDGYDATRELRRREGNGPRTPVVALTASAFREDRQRCLAAGMDDVVTKPIDTATLLRAIQRQVAGAGAQAVTSSNPA